MRLNKFLEANSITATAFAERIGLTPSQVSRLSRGVNWPTKETAERIREATNGAVTADDFLPPRPEADAA